MSDPFVLIWLCVWALSSAVGCILAGRFDNFHFLFWPVCFGWAWPVVIGVGGFVAFFALIGVALRRGAQS
jgi:hypothetical protein